MLAYPDTMTTKRETDQRDVNRGRRSGVTEAERDEALPHDEIARSNAEAMIW